jgi:hypothetical protein
LGIENNAQGHLGQTSTGQISTAAQVAGAVQILSELLKTG